MRDAVAIVRMTRTHPRFSKGASIRAAVSIVSIAARLTGTDRLRSAALTALATRVELRDEEDADLASAVDELLDDLKKN